MRIPAASLSRYTTSFISRLSRAGDNHDVEVSLSVPILIGEGLGIQRRAPPPVVSVAGMETACTELILTRIETDCTLKMSVCSPEMTTVPLGMPRWKWILC